MAKQPYERLEQELADWAHVHVEGMVVCSSGTAALHLALEALQLPQGSSVLVPDFSMIAVPRAAALADLTPVLIDCGEDLNIDQHAVNGAIGMAEGPVAVMIVHTYGRRCDTTYFMDGHDHTDPRVYMIEDLAEAHGLKPLPTTDAACWSFYRNKLVRGQEGGAVWFRNPAHAVIARELRCQGFTSAHNFQHRPRGHNYRMADCCAELISYSLLNVFNETLARRRMEAAYDAICPKAWRLPARDVPWVYDVRVPGLTRESQQAAVRELNDRGIAARMSFYPNHLQEEFKDATFYYGMGHRSTLMSNMVLYFPLTGIPVEDIGLCFDVVRHHVDHVNHAM